MKRALIVLLILAVAGGLFAQINFGGSVASGLLLNFDDDGHGFYTSKSDAGDEYSYGFSATYDAPSGIAGGKVGFSGANGDPWGLDGANVWFKPLDILTLSSSGQGTGFGTPAAADTNNGVNDSRGLNLVLEPIAGLAFGATVVPNNGLEIAKAAYGLGVNFSMADVFGAVANMKFDGESEAVNAAAGVTVDALSYLAGLTLAADIGAENVTKLSDEGAVTAGAKLGLKVADLGAGLSVALKIPVQESQEMNTKIGADLSYPIGDASLGLGVNYVLKGVGKTGKFEAGSVDFDYPEEGVDSSALTIHPSVSFSVGEAALKIGYGLSATMGDEMTLGHVVYTGFSIDLK